MPQPTILQVPFAYAAGGAYINDIPIAAASPLASYHDGFPPAVFPGGGSPVSGQDFNGIFNAISASVVWANAGGQWTWDSGYAGNAGYSIGAILAGPDGSSMASVVNLTTTNTTAPAIASDVLTGGWAPYGGAYALAGNYAHTTSNLAGAFSITTTLPYVAPIAGQEFTFICNNNNVNSPVTLAINGGAAYPLVRSDGGNIQLGDLSLGSIYSCTYVHGVGYQLRSLVNSQVRGLSRASACSGLLNPPVQLLTAGNQVMTGAGVVITPYATGSLLVGLAGYWALGAVGTYVATLYYGTGSVPAVGSPIPGGALSTLVTATSISASGASDVQLAGNSIITGLTPGTQYWLSLAVTEASNSISAELYNTVISAIEI